MLHRKFAIVIFMSVIAMFCIGCASSPGYTGGPAEERDNAVLVKVTSDLKNCPSRIIIEGVESNVSQFNSRTDTIIIGNGSLKSTKYRASTIAHETVHLCLARISNGRSATETYRFMDEGYARLYDRRMLGMSNEEIDKLVYGKLKNYPETIIDFEQAMSWTTFFGRPNALGTVGWDAYYVGVSFQRFLEDAYGKELPLKLFEEIGTSLTFDRALKAATGESRAIVEQRWQAYVRDHIRKL